MAMNSREMSQLVVQWELEAGESFYEYSGLLSEPHEVLELANQLQAKGLLEDYAMGEIESDAFPEVITLVNCSKAFNSGDRQEYFVLLDQINAYIMQDQKEYMKFVRHYVNGMEPSKSKVYQDYMKKGEEL